MAEKLWLPTEIGLNDALTQAEDDLKAGAAFYREHYLNRRPRP